MKGEEMSGKARGAGAGPIEVGTRLELFTDDLLVDRMEGGAARRLHHPVACEIVIVHDAPWEGNTSAYHTTFRDGDVYRMYYRGSQGNRSTGKTASPQVACYAESPDGVRWTKPELGLVEFEGSKANNIIWDGAGSHNFAPFKDANPDCAPDAAYKAFGSGKGGLHAFKSADGIHWSMLTDDLVITDGRFDSQNVGFWDPVHETYRAYWRDLRPGSSVLYDPERTNGARDIKTATSPDFVTWTEGRFLDYGDGAPFEHLYTNQVLPYYRAPHVLLGFPTRFVQARGSLTEGLLMSSRDGVSFERWEEALIRPGLNPARWGNRCNYIWRGIVETASDVRGAPAEISIYSTEGYYEGESNCVRRFASRVDGFASVNAPFAGGSLVTRPIVFEGKTLVINFSTAAQGLVRVEIADEKGKPLEGFSLDDCDEIYGDDLARAVKWGGGGDVSRLAGRPVRLRFEMKDADLYSLRFTE
jgi:hypothetical protein